ncbi:MAG: hypothetical protein RIG84_09950 [Roseovarius sp.]
MEDSTLASFDLPELASLEEAALLREQLIGWLANCPAGKAAGTGAVLRLARADSPALLQLAAAACRTAAQAGTELRICDAEGAEIGGLRLVQTGEAEP